MLKSDTIIVNFAAYRTKIISGLGLSGLYMFGLGAYVSPPLVAFGLGFMFIAFCMCLPAFPSIRCDSLLMLSLAFAVYLVARTIVAIVELPQTRTAQIDQALDLFQLGYLFAAVMAFWFADSPRRVYRVLLLALFGLVIRILIEVEVNDLQEFLTNRPGFGMPVNAFGLYAATAVLGLLLLAPNFWGAMQKRKYFILRVIIWLFILTVFIQGLIISQSRSAYLAVIIVFPPLLGIKLYVWLKSSYSRHKRRVGMLAGFSLLVIIFVLFANLSTIKNRITSDLDAFKLIHSGKVKGTSYISVTIRYEAWRLGMKKWFERPLFGWGPGSSAYLIQKSNIEIFDARYHGGIVKDFHNSYLETLVQTGLIGAAFFAIALWLMAKTVWQAYRAGWLSLEVFLFVVGALGLFLVTTCFNLRTGDHLGRHHLTLFGGIAYAYRYHKMKSGLKASDPANTA
jgi:O-antigen ligase